MKLRKIFLSLVMAWSVVWGIQVVGQAGMSLLVPGKYSAKVTAIACEACPPEIMKTLQAQTGVKDITVDAKTSTVQFTVLPGAHVWIPELQKALKAASDQMGMGADFELKNLVRAADTE